MEAAHQESAGGGGGEEKICSKKIEGKSWYCKNVSGDNKLQYCDKHLKDFTDFYIENPSLITANKSKCLPKKKMEEIELMKKNKLPLPDGHLCRLNTGSWRCRNLRMGHGDDHTGPKSTYCQKHYKYYSSLSAKRWLLKKRNRDGEARDSNFSKMRKNVMEEHNRSINVTGIQPPTTDIQGGGSANVGAKRKNVEGTKWSGELDDLLIEEPSLITSNEMKKKNLPPDEQICSFISDGGKWRCKNFRMSHGAADDPRVPNSKYCEKHYNYYVKYYKKKKLLKKKKKTNTGDGAHSGPIQLTWGSKRRRTMKEDEDTSDIEGGAANVEAKMKNVQGTEWPGELDFSDFLIEKPSFVTSKKIHNDMEKKKLPTNEQYCCHTSGIGRCNNFGMSHGAAAADDSRVQKTKFCEKHYNYYSKYPKKRRSGYGEGAGCSTATGLLEETKGEKVTEEDDEAEIQKLGAAGNNTSVTIGNERGNAETIERSGEIESLAGIGETVVESESLEHYKSLCFELSMELEKKKVECTILQGRLALEEETRKTSVANRTPTDATECWRKLFSDMAGCVQSHISDLDSIVLRMENKISTLVGCVESLKTGGKGNSILRCELRNSEKIESKAQGSQNDVTQSAENQIDENHRSRPNAETSSGGRKYSHVYQCKEKVMNVYDVGSLHLSSGGKNDKEGKGCGCSDERPSSHGSSSPGHLEMSTHPFVNLVSDDDSVEILGESEDSDGSTDSEGSLGTLMDMLAMKYRNRDEDKDKETKWKFEDDMLSSFEEDPELCLKAVCALYRQQISGDEISDKELLDKSDALRCTTLAKFLMDGDCEGDLNKSVKQLEIIDSNAVDDCKRLARRYSIQLFNIYQKEKDPYFLPATTGSHGNQTTK